MKEYLGNSMLVHELENHYAVEYQDKLYFFPKIGTPDSYAKAVKTDSKRFHDSPLHTLGDTLGEVIEVHHVEA